MFKKLLLILVCLFVLCSMPSAGGITDKHKAVIGRQNVAVGGSCTTLADEEDGTPTTEYQVANNSTSVYRGTKFQAGSTYDVCKVILPLQKTTEDPHAQTFKAEIWSSDGGAPPVPLALMGQASDTSVTRDSLATSFADITFAWTSATKASLTNGNYYFVAVHMIAGTTDGTDYILWNASGTGTGAGSDEDIANANSTPSWSNTSSFSTLLGATYK